MPRRPSPNARYQAGSIPLKSNSASSLLWQVRAPVSGGRSTFWDGYTPRRARFPGSTEGDPAHSGLAEQCDVSPHVRDHSKLTNFSLATPMDLRHLTRHRVRARTIRVPSEAMACDVPSPGAGLLRRSNPPAHPRHRGTRLLQHREVTLRRRGVHELVDERDCACVALLFVLLRQLLDDKPASLRGRVTGGDDLANERLASTSSFRLRHGPTGTMRGFVQRPVARLASSHTRDALLKQRQRLGMPAETPERAGTGHCGFDLARCRGRRRPVLYQVTCTS